jgi:hypothetical protein
MRRRHLGIAARARLEKTVVGHLVVGVLLLIAGAVVTIVSKEVVWYGAIVVGLIEVARGGYYLKRGARD